MSENINGYMDVSEIPGADQGEGEDVEITLEKFELVTIDSDINKRDLDVASDYCKVRAGMDFQQQMLMEAAKIALESARNSEHPKHMEVFATLMAQLTTLNAKIITVHKDVAEISKPIAPTEPTGMNIQAENVFVGSTADLMEKYGSQQDAQDEKVIEHEG